MPHVVLGAAAAVLAALLSAPHVADAGVDVMASSWEEPGVARQGCGEMPSLHALTLTAFVSRTLCHDPRSAAAWARIQSQDAATGLARSSYYPQAEVSAGYGHVDESARYDNAPEQKASLRGPTNNQALSLTWVLYDFGLRAAQLTRERARLQAALSAQEDAVRTVLSDAVAAYFSAVQADRFLSAHREAEALARRSLRVVEDKLAAGIATEADRLQAKTAVARATVARVSAERAGEAAHGALAIMMGLPPETELSIDAGHDIEEAPQLGDLAGHLIERAVRAHPRVAAALSQIQAADADVAAAESSGMPRLSFSAIGERSENPAGRVLAKQTVNAGSVGLQLSVPLFDGFSRQARIKGAQAAVANSQAELHAVEQQVTREIWRWYVAVRNGVQDMQASQDLLDSARESYQLAAGRYQSGVGTVIEMLMAQSDLAAARAHQASVLSELRSARLQLAVMLGKAVDGAEATRGTELERAAGNTAQTPLPAPQDAEPRIVSVEPAPVPGGQGPRALTIKGENFSEGALVHLESRSDGLSFPARVPIVFDSRHLWVWVPVGCAADWTAVVQAQDGRRSAPYAFELSGSC